MQRHYKSVPPFFCFVQEARLKEIAWCCWMGLENSGAPSSFSFKDKGFLSAAWQAEIQTSLNCYIAMPGNGFICNDGVKGIRVCEQAEIPSRDLQWRCRNTGRKRGVVVCIFLNKLSCPCLFSELLWERLVN